MRILCYGYRPWATSIYQNILESERHQVIIGPADPDLDASLIEDISPSLILFYGWSWIIPEEITGTYTCLMLHPSNLPKYRGGSPIQNQILDGIIETKLTLFKMAAGIDDGPILGQRDLSLTGNMTAIFERLATLGLDLTRAYLRGDLAEVEQDDSGATYCKRRKPIESEITFDELRSASALQLYNKIRALSDPYPNAYLRTSDNRMLMIRDATIRDE